MQKMVTYLGEAPDIHGSGKRNANLLAIAPNASSGIICSGTSPSIEPYRANCYTHKTLSGSYQVKNKYLEKLLKSKGLKGKELENIWKDISGTDGSVQHLDILTDDEKEIFKTANEINQIWIVEHAYKRQEFICQAQSVPRKSGVRASIQLEEINACGRNRCRSKRTGQTDRDDRKSHK